jgi:GNAT superfamily N-acetyltransferase
MAYGAERDVDLSTVEATEALTFEQLCSKEIRIGCMTLHSSVRGRGLAVSMIEYLLRWAREHGWKKVRARAMLDGEPQAFYPTLSWWRGLGFKAAGTVRSFGPSRDPIEQANATDLILDLKDWNPRRG